MQEIGTVSELWRYPVKSMRGERLRTAVFDSSGMAGDRRFAVVSSSAPVGKPLLTSRERTAMLLYAPALDPTPGVLTPSGERLPLPSPQLVATLQDALAAPGATLELEHSPDVPLTDVRPVSLVSRATLRALGDDLGGVFDAQRLRSNLILDLQNGQPFEEEQWSGQILQLGIGPDSAQLRVLERIPRCRIVSLDPGTAETSPAMLRRLARQRNGRAAMYAVVVRPGTVAQGAPITLQGQDRSGVPA